MKEKIKTILIVLLTAIICIIGIVAASKLADKITPCGSYDYFLNNIDKCTE